MDRWQIYFAKPLTHFFFLALVDTYLLNGSGTPMKHETMYAYMYMYMYNLY